MVRVFDGFVFGQQETAVLHLRVDTTCAHVDAIIVSEGTTSLAGTRVCTSSKSSPSSTPLLLRSVSSLLRRGLPPPSRSTMLPPAWEGGGPDGGPDGGQPWRVRQ